MKRLTNKLTKALSIFLILIVVLGHTLPGVAVLAEEPTPTPIPVMEPTAPLQPDTNIPTPVPPMQPSTVVPTPTAPLQPNTAIPTPIAPMQPNMILPTPVPLLTPTLPQTNTSSSNTSNTTNNNEERRNRERNEGAQQAQAPLANNSNSNGTGVTQFGGNGGTIDTGDANNSGVQITNGNNNVSSGGTGDGSGLSIVNNGNGANSTNQGSAGITNTDNTNQNNQANVDNGLTLHSDSGNNSSNANLGDVNIKTGDANTSGTIITAVNTNIDGVLVSEFNVADDQNGDIILDFAAGCISGCGTQDVNVANKNNQANSTNTANAALGNESNTFQNNDANIGSDLILTANSGYNDANYNGSGSNTIETGDANVSGNVLTFANNNFAGDIVYGVVNIYGDLRGDIIFPEEQLSMCCGGNISASNSGNGAFSDNNASANLSNTNNTTQGNLANINNNLDLTAMSGNNDVNYNGGNNTIETGNTTIDANVLNVANNNLNGGNMWLVLINDAGNWIGRLIGGDGNMAASGTVLTVDDKGQITASNNGNGAGSTNNANVSETNSNNVTQNNNADINNNVTLAANTGGNSASMNVGGDNKVVTGDAQVVLNMVNFVNNNITGGGKIFVTVVNVFGSWVGDFVAPGQQKQAKEAAAQTTGGTGGGNKSSESHSQSQNETQNPVTSAVLGWMGSQAPKTPSESTSNQNQGGVMGLFKGSNETPKTTNFSEIAESGVKGASLKTKNKIKINLAWLILALPFAILFIIRKRLAKVVNAISALL